MPLNSLENLNFNESLSGEIEQALKDISHKENLLSSTISKSLIHHKIQLRNYIIFIRDNLREEFDDFFNNLLTQIRQDWNLFSVQELLIKETKKFTESVTKNLDKILESGGSHLYSTANLKKYYDSLNDAQQQISQCKEDWTNYEKGVLNLT